MVATRMSPRRTLLISSLEYRRRTTPRTTPGKATLPLSVDAAASAFRKKYHRKNLLNQNNVRAITRSS